MNEIINLKNIDYNYNDNQIKALNGVNLSVYEGEWVSIIGPNGSGKSTLAKTINGLLVPDAGSVYVGGDELNEENLWRIRQLVGMVFQNPDNQFVGTTVQDDVAFGLENLGLPRDEMIVRIQKSLKEVGMTKFATNEPARLSGGQKQRVAIAGIIALQPKIIILDEATSMLDPRGRAEVLKTVREVKAKENLTVLSITHDIDEASSSDRIFVMNQGKIQRIGQPEDIFQAGESLIDLGLDLPFPEKLKLELRGKGFDLPDDYIDGERLVELLWKYNSRK